MIQIHNLKISAFFEKELISSFCTSNESLLTKRRNYYIFGEKPEIITTLYSNGSCNITNIKNISSIQPYLQKMNVLMGGTDDQPNISYRIDNITATSSFHQSEDRLELSSFCNYCILKNSPEITKVSFNNLNFPNCFLRTNYGTLILSSNRKCSMVGFKSLETLEYIRNVLSNLLVNYQSSIN